MSASEASLEAADGKTVLADWIERHGPSVYGFLRARVRDPNQTDDLFQETFTRALRAFRSYRDEGKPRAFLLKIADRLIAEKFRRRKREGALDAEAEQELAAAESGPVRKASRSEARARLEQELDALTEDQRRVLLLRFYGDMTFAEISRILEQPLGTVLSHSRRGLAALKKRMAENPL
ncbi:MAG TPA: RNA polymerase sigma factor [Pirellulaceae bacterium]|jgi:RNA polymerase sigma-70 factor (ECF subfamily)|nr:RNA polymerase sigma factor [Pirellulaceae bacterium]